jgi:hypothetical protein
LVVKGIRAEPSTRSLRTVTASASEGENVTTVRRGSAIGNAQPRL